MRSICVVIGASALLASCSEGNSTTEEPAELQTIACRDEVIDASSTLCTRALVSGSVRTAELDAIFSQLPVSRTPCAAKAREVADQTINRVISGPAPQNPMDLVDKCGAAARTQIRLHCNFSCEVAAADDHAETPRRVLAGPTQASATAAADAEQARREADEAAAAAAAIGSSPQSLTGGPNRFEPDSFPMKDAYRFHTATIETIAGVGSADATMTGRVTRADANLYCEADPDGEAETAGRETCVERVLRREAGRTYRASADCQRRTVTAPWGRTYREVSAGSWRDAETGENPEDSGMVSGYASIGPIWQRLCGV